MTTKRLLLASALAGASILATLPAQAFWGWNPFGWGGGPWDGPWGGGPWYGGYPYYGGYPGYGMYGVPYGYGWGAPVYGYPGYAYPGYAYPAPPAPQQPATQKSQ